MANDNKQSFFVGCNKKCLFFMCLLPCCCIKKIVPRPSCGRHFFLLQGGGLIWGSKSSFVFHCQNSGLFGQPNSTPNGGVLFGRGFNMKG